MRRLTAAMLFASMFVLPSNAQAQTKPSPEFNQITEDSAPVLQWCNGGIVQGHGGSPATCLTVPAAFAVPNNAGLSALSTLATPYALRLGYAVAGDDRPLVFSASPLACPLNAGAGDGGSQVLSADGKCWLADFNGVVYPSDFGSKHDTVSIPDGVILAGGNIINSATRSCVVANDPGKQIILWGSGALGVPQQGTVLSCSGSGYVVSFTAIFATPWSGAWTASVAATGTGYVQGNLLTTAGGTGVIADSIFSVSTTKVATAAVNAPGSGGANGACTVLGTSGTGLGFQATGTIAAGAMTGAWVVSVPGSYTINPASLVSAPVVPQAGCSGLVGATMTIAMGVGTVTNTNPGHWVSQPSPNSVTGGSGSGATLNLVAYDVGDRVTIGSDDWTAVSAANVAAIANKARLHFSSGDYWLASQTSCLNLNGETLSGDGWPTDNFPFSGGSMLLISNTVTSAFCGMNTVTFRDIAVWYPLQNGGSVSPIVYPPTFESPSWVDDVFTHARFLNSYQLAKVDLGGSGWGRVMFPDVLSYCIDKCVWFLNGAADTFQGGATDYWGPGAYGSVAIAGPANLQRYTAANAEFIRVDIGGGSYTQIDGLLMTGGIVQGMRYALRLLSGDVNVSNWSNVNCDSIGSVLSVEGSAFVTSIAFLGGEVYSTNFFNPAAAADVFSFTSNVGSSQLTIGGGMYVAFAQGHVISDANSGLQSLHVNGNRFDNFGSSTTANQYAALWLIGSNAFIDVTDNESTGNLSSGNTLYFAVLQGFESGTIQNNKIDSTTWAIADLRAPPATLLTVSGNTTVRTNNTPSLKVTGTAAATIDVNNSFDKPAQPVLTSGWGTSPTQTAASSDNFSRITVGAAPASPAVMTFNFAKPVAPQCTAIDETTPTIGLTAVATPLLVSIVGAKVAGNVVSVKCSYAN